MSTVKTGLELFKKNIPRSLRGARAGLLVHPASVDARLDHALKIVRESKRVELRALFGPQHGIRGETQDNMVEWRSFKDPQSGFPAYSLYGKVRKPTPEMLKDTDILIIDLQDIGARYYTFIWTMALCMEACAEAGKSVLVLDRPNPIAGKEVEGAALDAGYESFVGLRPLPPRHGMTMGEIGLYLREEFYPNLNFHVVQMKGWKRRMWFPETGLPWVMPSPNMPTAETAAVYPGMCLLEGTNLSEGRGTTRPFEIFGAPFAEPESLVGRLREFRLPGVVMRPLHFEPTFQKHAGKLCGGAQIHVPERDKFRPFKTAAAVLKTFHDLYPERFEWKKPPYEYEKKKMPIDILSGSDRLRRDIERGEDIRRMEERWAEECRVFEKTRRKYLLYV